MLRQDAGDVEGDVAVADHRDLFRLERPGARHVGVTIEPADELCGAVAAVEVDTGHLEVGVANRPGREDHGVVVLLQVVEGDVATVEDIAKQADASTVEHLAQSRDDALDARVVGGDAITNQPVGCGQLLEQVDGDIELLLGLEQDVRGIDSRGSCTNDGQTELGHKIPIWFV